jgi:hypothetical protein
MEKFNKLSVGDLQTLNRVSDRMNLVEFVNFDHNKQNRILKSCIKKSRYDDLKSIALHIVDKYNQQGVALNFYGCEHCKGYHVTGVNKERRNQIKEMIIKLKARLADSK